MEEVINKSDGQFKDILDEIVDFNKHESKKDPLIKELNRSERNPNPSNSLNSSTYSSAASSILASSSSTSSNSSTLSSVSIFLSSSSKQQGGAANVSVDDKHNQSTNNVEIAKMQELGKTAKIFEHRFPHSVYLQANSRFLGVKSDLENKNSQKISLGVNPSQYMVSSLADTTLENINSPSNTWRTINGKRDKRKRKPVERKILAGEIPGNIGKKSVEELENFIKSGTSSHAMKAKSKNKYNNHSSYLNFSDHKQLSQHMNPIIKRNENQAAARSQMSKTVSNKSTNQPNDNQNHPKQQQQPTNQKQTQMPNNEQNNINHQDQESPKSPSVSKRNFIAHSQGDAMGVIRSPKEAPNKKVTTQQNTKPILKETSSNNISAQQNKPPQSKNTNQQHQPYQQPDMHSAVSTDAVTFANHLHFDEKDDVSKIKFGFFADAADVQNSKTTNNLTNKACENDSIKKAINHKQQPQASNSMPKLNVPGYASKPQLNSNNIQSNQSIREIKQDRKQFKASRNSEENCIKPKHEVVTFNYEQVLKYISNAWQSSQAQKA